MSTLSIEHKAPAPETDADNNGLPDAWETEYFGQTGINPDADADSDGLSNAQEQRRGTIPTSVDTDGDGLPDGQEVALGTDPTIADGISVPDITWLSRLITNTYQGQEVLPAPGLPGFLPGSQNNYRRLVVQQTITEELPEGYESGLNDLGTRTFTAEYNPSDPDNWSISGQRIRLDRYPDPGVNTSYPMNSAWHNHANGYPGATEDAHVHFTSLGSYHPPYLDSVTIYYTITIDMTLSDLGEPVVIPPYWVQAADSWLAQLPSVGRSDTASSSAEYRLLVPSGSGGTLRWFEVFTPANGGAKQYALKEWQIDGVLSPTFTLSIPAAGTATIEPFSVTAELAVDANRDGTIKLASEDASDATSADKPYRFWLNDDVDRYHQDPGYSELEFDDIDPAEIASQGWQPDWTYNQITSLRDLDDFSRLWISLHGITDAVRNGDLYIGLRWSNTTGDPWIKLYPHVEADGGTKYLFDSSTAGVPLTQQTTTNAIADLRTGSTVTVVAPEDGTFVFPTSVFANLTESAPVTHLLFEGCQAGTGQLQIVILKKDGSNYTEIGQGPGVWLDLKEPKEFIQRWSSGDADRAAPQSWVRLNANSGTFAPPATDEEKDMVLYVHGYNMNGGADLAGDKQRWIETTYKRLYWLGYKGRVGGFSWPCAIQGGFTDNKGFDDSEQRAWQSGTYLMQLLSSLKTAGYRVHLLAHSQGNVVAGEALSLWKALGNTTPLVSTYIASQGAIPAHCYDATLPSRTDFTPSAPNVYGRYWTSGDSATLPATWGTSNPSYLATNYVQNAAGRFANFYNPDDYALTGNGLTGSEHPGWMIDQRLKPDVTYGYTSGNGFNVGQVPLRFPDDHYQIFSYAAPAWSFALGATSTGGVFNQNAVNLKASFTFGSEHLWHSGEFRSYNAARYRYWMSLLDAALIPHLNP